jgi:hypothetical protein
MPVAHPSKQEKRLMRKVFYVIVGLLLCLAFGNPVPAAMRCDNFSVRQGVHAEEVLHHCGEPVSKSEGELRGKRGGRSIEKWIYGPEAGYLYILYFSNGVLEEIEEKRAE